MKTGLTQDNIRKSFKEFDLEKGKKTGIYMDTPENRSKHRVGQKYSKEKLGEVDAFAKKLEQADTYSGRGERKNQLDAIMSKKTQAMLGKDGVKRMIADGEGNIVELSRHAMMSINDVEKFLKEENIHLEEYAPGDRVTWIGKTGDKKFSATVEDHHLGDGTVTISLDGSPKSTNVTVNEIKKMGKISTPVESGTMTAKEAKLPSIKVLRPSGDNKPDSAYTDALKKMTINQRSVRLNKAENFINRDTRVFTDSDKKVLLDKVKEWKKDYVGTSSLKSGKNDISVDFDGKISVNGVPVVIDASSGYVKLGGAGRSSSRGEFHPAGAFNNQLQGIDYVRTAAVLKRLIREGKSLKEIDSEMLKTRSPLAGQTLGSSWSDMKKHFKL